MRILRTFDFATAQTVNIASESLHVSGLVQNILTELRLSATKVKFFFHKAPHLHALETVDTQSKEVIGSRELDAEVFAEFLQQICLEFRQGRG